MQGIDPRLQEPIEGLLVTVLLLVGIACGMLIEQRWGAIERRQDAYEAAQRHDRQRLDKMDSVMFGGI